MEWLFVKTLVSLGAVIGMMVGLVYLLKKFVGQGQAAGASIVPIDVLGQRSFGPKRSVMVLRVADKVMVIGMTEQGMHPLSEITGRASLKRIRERSLEAAGRPTFGDLLQKHAARLIRRPVFRPGPVPFRPARTAMPQGSPLPGAASREPVQ